MNSYSRLTVRGEHDFYSLNLQNTADTTSERPGPAAGRPHMVEMGKVALSGACLMARASIRSPFTSLASTQLPLPFTLQSFFVAEGHRLPRSWAPSHPALTTRHIAAAMCALLDQRCALLDQRCGDRDRQGMRIVELLLRSGLRGELGRAVSV